DAPDKQLSLVPGAVDDAESFLRDHGTTQASFDRVARLVEGFETPFGLELLATVHWVATREHALAQDDMVRATYAWNPSKRQFTRSQIGLAADRLRTEGWLSGLSATPLRDKGNGVGA
ncbi:MAG: hypothetical protein AAB368_10190, partial [bacterium]